MYNSLFPSIPPERSDANLMPTEDDNSADTLPDSATTLLRMSREGLHLTLIGMWGASVEHRLFFSLDNQKTVSFLITAISQIFATIYSALLVFVTQTLWMRRSLQMDRTLTAMHDHAAAWTGIGSAMRHVWHQKTTAASLTGTFAVFLYLGNILILHISTPALFSLQTFNFTRPVQVETNSLPSYNFGNTTDVTSSDAFVKMSFYAMGSLYSLPSILGSTQNLGLNGSTLYDVLDPNSGSGNVTVNATGFNITCRYLEPSPDSLSYDGSGAGWAALDLGLEMYSTQPGIISSLISGNTSNNSFYSTIPIIDSDDNHPPEVNLTPPMNNTYIPVTFVQLFQCSQSLVNQTVVVDAQSRMVLSVEPEIYKKTSTWLPSNSSPVTTNTGNPLIDLWGAWYGAMPPSAFPRDGSAAGPDFVSVADINAPSTVMLHDLENTLGEIVAGMFWTPAGIVTHWGEVGNILPTSGPLSFNDGPVWAPTRIGPRTTSPTFLRGNAFVTEIQTRMRLDITAGLTTSFVLALLSLPSIIFNKRVDQREIPIDGTGMLHAIWLYRNSPELETELEQVENPTDANLREAGMVRVNWADGGLRRQKSGSESF
ncbi:hypothetical protein B0H16DRAFT_1468119 [Mycena metata]|uniref:Uncharacterized protein n=1 Tax=Mycena metata TaxID=1033252 RepID=A0AAD7I2E7_9AGAR|nr:hypothetical protein B0H16DRAFT_1468119 [Mycena metata]